MLNDFMTACSLDRSLAPRSFIGSNDNNAASGFDGTQKATFENETKTAKA